MKRKVVVLGPPPGSPGGIGMLMRHLESSLGYDVRFDFVDSGTTDSRLKVFLSAALKCVSVRSVKGRPLFYFNIASRGSTLRKAILALLVTCTGGRYVLHLHGAEYQDFYQRSNFLLRLAIRMLFSRADRVLVLGRSWRKFVVETLGVPDRQVGILTNAVPGPDQVPDRSAASVEMLFIGRSGARKGLNELLTASASLKKDKNWALTLAGDADNDQTREILASSPLVRYTGWIDQSELALELARASVFVLPSHAEGLPLALLDAMAWGLAPIVTDVGSIGDVIEDGINGILVPVGDVRALAQAMELLINDDQLRSRIGNAARRTWQRELDISQYLARLEHELDMALAKEGPGT